MSGNFAGKPVALQPGVALRMAVCPSKICSIGRKMRHRWRKGSRCQTLVNNGIMGKLDYGIFHGIIWDIWDIWDNGSAAFGLEQRWLGDVGLFLQ